VSDLRDCDVLRMYCMILDANIVVKLCHMLSHLMVTVCIYGLSWVAVGHIPLKPQNLFYSFSL
jgi:hypothetical protein